MGLGTVGLGTRQQLDKFPRISLTSFLQHSVLLVFAFLVMSITGRGEARSYLCHSTHADFLLIPI